ncbi:hypothetical protein, partial [Klebsiella pneumoniae]|uniref:hypothetical protein n=1 Tax=Klebsiella pneumoniae TaxID=573 RepID=UPI0025A0718A
LGRRDRRLFQQASGVRSWQRLPDSAQQELLLSGRRKPLSGAQSWRRAMRHRDGAGVRQLQRLSP